MERIERNCGSCGSWEREHARTINGQAFAMCALCLYAKAETEYCKSWKLCQKKGN